MKLGISLGRKHQIFIGLILTRKRKTTNMPCHPEAIPLKQFKKGITTNHTPNYNRINAWPLQFLRTGAYDRSYGYLNVRTTAGFWWSNTAGSATYGRALNTWSGNVYAQNYSFRGSGFALRGVANHLFMLQYIQC